MYFINIYKHAYIPTGKDYLVRVVFVAYELIVVVLNVAAVIAVVLRVVPLLRYQL
jgi:hypothetical protein